MVQLLPRLHRLHREERGVSTVEFALIAVPVLLLVFGVLDFGLGIWTWNNLSQAVNQGVREAIVRGAGSPLGQPGDPGNDIAGGSWTGTCATAFPSSSIAGQVCTFARALDPSRLSVTITWQSCAPSCLVGPSTVTVGAHYQFEPLLSRLFPFTINLRSQATMRVACCSQ
jgi:Flp pilus assembly protein TadG